MGWDWLRNWLQSLLENRYLGGLDSLLAIIVVLAGGVFFVVYRLKRSRDRADPATSALAAPPVQPPPHGDYRKHYLKLVEYQCRFLDMKGMRTQSPHSLMLEEVFIDLRLDTRAFIGASPNPVAPSTENIPPELRTGSHAIWDYLQPRGRPMINLAILGAPGSGKTTVLRHVALTLALPPRQRRHAQQLKKLPILLYLRDHAEAIGADPAPSLVQVIEQALTRLGQQQVPCAWFTHQVQQGACLVLLDGLDEVADPDVRRRVVAWVERQMQAYGASSFLLTSRSYGYQDNPLHGVNVLHVQPFTPEQVARFVHNWYLANEKMSAQRDDAGVRLQAWQGAEDLLHRLSAAGAEWVMSRAWCSTWSLPHSRHSRRPTHSLPRPRPT